MVVFKNNAFKIVGELENRIGLETKVYALNNDILMHDEVSYCVVSVIEDNLFYRDAVSFVKQLGIQECRISAVSPNKQVLALADCAGTVYLCSLANHQLTLTTTIPSDLRPVQLAVSNKSQVAVQSFNSPHLVFLPVQETFSAELAQQLAGRNVQANEDPCFLSKGRTACVSFRSAMICCPFRQVEFCGDQLVYLTEFGELYVFDTVQRTTKAFQTDCAQGFCVKNGKVFVRKSQI